jgi:hypothetical protein
MSDLIFYTNGEETSRIPFPTPGTKCPETKLEIKMTETDISKVFIEGDYATIMGVKYKRVEEPKPRMEYQESGTVDKVEYNGHTYLRIDYDNDSWYGGVWWKQIERHKSPMNVVFDNETRNILEGLWFNQVKKGVIDEPEHYDEVEWDEKDNSKPMDEVVNRLLEKWKTDPPEFLKFELGKTLEDLITRWWLDTHTDYKDWDVPTCVDDLIDQIQLWLPREQSAEGSQSISVIDTVDGYNDALKKIKSKLRNKR